MSIFWSRRKSCLTLINVNVRQLKWINSLTEGQDDEEWEPAEQESSDDDAQRLGRFLLAAKFEKFGRRSVGGGQAFQGFPRLSFAGCWTVIGVTRSAAAVGGWRRLSTQMIAVDCCGSISRRVNIVCDNWKRNIRLIGRCLLQMLATRFSRESDHFHWRARPARVDWIEMKRRVVQTLPVRTSNVDAERDLGTARWFGRFGAALQELGLTDGGPINAPVQRQDDQHRQIKRADDAEEDVARLSGDSTHQRVAVIGQHVALLPSQQRPDADGQRRNPHTNTKQTGTLGGHDRIVIQRSGHTNVAIHWNDAQRQNWCRAAQDVHRCPHVAKDGAKVPLARHLKQMKRLKHFVNFQSETAVTP